MKIRTPGIVISTDAGFTLIELMVAGVCLGLAITGVIAMISAGQVLEMESSLRHQAKMFAAEELERDDLHYQAAPPSNGVLTTKTVTLNNGTITLNNGTVTLNNGQNVSAGLTVTVSSGTANYNGYNSPTIPVVYKQIQVQVSWPLGSPTQNIILEKRIADIR